MQFRIERLPFRIDLFDLRLFEGLGQQSQRGVLAFDQAGVHRALLESWRCASSSESFTADQVLRELLDGELARALEILGGALADVVHLGQRAQVLLPVVLGALFGRRSSCCRRSISTSATAVSGSTVVFSSGPAVCESDSRISHQCLD